MNRLAEMAMDAIKYSIYCESWLIQLSTLTVSTAHLRPSI